VRGAKVLLAILRPRHRPPRADRGVRDEVVLRVELAPRAKAAAHVKLHQPHPAQVLPTEQPREDALVDVRDLGRTPEGQLLGYRVVLREQAATLQRNSSV